MGNAGAYFALKLRLPLIRVAPLADGSAPAPFLSLRAKSGVASSTATPCLAIAGRGGQHHEGMGGNAAGLFRVQVVKLHQFGAVRNTRAYNHVMLMGRGFPEYRADGAAETRLWCGSAVTSVHFDMGRKTKPPRNIEEAISSISSFN